MTIHSTAAGFAAFDGADDSFQPAPLADVHRSGVQPDIKPVIDRSIKAN
jgi:hypothetical protein